MFKINIIRIQSKGLFITKNGKRNHNFSPNSNGGNRWAWANWASLQIQKPYQGQSIEGTQLATEYRVLFLTVPPKFQC